MVASGLKAVIFDFGGVILDIDYRATEQAFARIFPPDLLPLYSQKDQKPLFDDLETGRISGDFFLAQLRGWAHPGTTGEELQIGWNAMLKGTRPERIEFLRQVKKRLRTFLLSNTNGIHKQVFDQTLARHMPQGETFDSLFERAYYSHEIGLRKPDPQVFRYVLERHGLEAESTLFVDDSIQHIESARSLGLKTHHLRGELLNSDELRQLLGFD